MLSPTVSMWPKFNGQHFLNGSSIGYNSLAFCFAKYDTNVQVWFYFIFLLFVYFPAHYRNGLFCNVFFLHTLSFHYMYKRKLGVRYFSSFFFPEPYVPAHYRIALPTHKFHRQFTRTKKEPSQGNLEENIITKHIPTRYKRGTTNFHLVRSISNTQNNTQKKKSSHIGIGATPSFFVTRHHYIIII